MTEETGAEQAMSEPWNGVPQNPERDGWHWVDDNVMRWSASQQVWLYTDDGTEWLYSPKIAKLSCWHYLAPCLTPAEVAAAVQAEREAIAAWHDGLAAKYGEWRNWGGPSNTDDQRREAIHAGAAKAIRARGDTSALDAAIRAAEARGIEQAAQICDSRKALHSTDDGFPNALSDEAADCAAAIRAMLTAAQEDNRDD